MAKRRFSLINKASTAPPAPVDSVFGRTGAVVALQADYDAFFLTQAEGDALYQPIGATVDSFNGRTGAVVPLQADYDGFFLTQAEGDTLYQPIGVTVDSFNGRTGIVVPLQADYDGFFLTPAEGNAAYATIGHLHDGILDTNLLDKTAAETISGIYTFSSIVDVTSNEIDIAGANPRVKFTNAAKTATFGFLFGDSTGFGLLTTGGAFAVKVPNGTSDVEVTGALTATSYGGVLEANLLDKTAAEVVSNNWEIGGATNISPDAGGSGQVKFRGAGYSGYVAMDLVGLHFGHNSSARNLTFDTNETTRMSISGTGAVDIVSSLTVGGSISLNDNQEMRFGTGNDIRLDFDANDFIIRTPSKIAMVIRPNGGVQQYYNGALRTITTNAGLDVTGSLSSKGSSAYLRMQERSADLTTDAGFGRIWVLNDAPSELWFTDDNGSAHHVAGGSLAEVFGTTKTSNETVTNSAVLQNDDELFLDLKAGFTYKLKLLLFPFDTQISNATGLKFDFSIPAGTTGEYVYNHWNGSGDTTATSKYVTDLTQDQSFSAISSAQNMIEVEGIIRVGGTAGVLQFRWAQQAAFAGESTIMQAGSHMSITLA